MTAGGIKEVEKRKRRLGFEKRTEKKNQFHVVGPNKLKWDEFSSSVSFLGTKMLFSESLSLSFYGFFILFLRVGRKRRRIIDNFSRLLPFASIPFHHFLVQSYLPFFSSLFFHSHSSLGPVFRSKITEGDDLVCRSRRRRRRRRRSEIKWLVNFKLADSSK